MSQSKRTSQEYTILLAIITGLVAVTLLVVSLVKGRMEASLRDSADKVLREQLPELGKVDAYVSSDRCQSCHPGEHASWKGTFHRSMTMQAKEGNVFGAFDNQTILSDGLEYAVYKTNNTFWARMPDPDLLMQAAQKNRKADLSKIPHVDRQVVMTTGSHHYQTYWVESPRMETLLQTLPLVYLIKDKRWIPREAAFMRGPEDRERMVTQWNHHCIRCHSTGWNPGLNDDTGMLETEVAELGISCEACHGPGEEHIALHQNPANRYGSRLGNDRDVAIVNPAKLDHERSSHVCGQCHGVFIPKDEVAMQIAHEGVQFKPGDLLSDSRYYIHYPMEGDPKTRWDELEKNPAFFRERWWEDGSILAGGREFTGMSRSECYVSGDMSCLSCHSMHDAPPADQLKPTLVRNQSCTQCHTEPAYNESISDHTFHMQDSSGSDCMNCHMPHTTYALFNAIRTHQIQSPRLKSSTEFGVPNACNLCHLDKSLGWAQDHMADRYGSEDLKLTEEQKSISAGLLWMLKGHAAQRAVAAWHAGWEPAIEVSNPDWMAPFLIPLLEDPYPVVRYIAYRSLQRIWPDALEDYDFMASKEILSVQSNALHEAWESKALPLTPNATVLVNDSGHINHRLLKRLLRQRDNRSITIKE